MNIKHKFSIGTRLSFCLNKEDDFWTNGCIVSLLDKNGEPHYELTDEFGLGCFMREVAEKDLKESF